MFKPQIPFPTAILCTKLQFRILIRSSVIAIPTSSEFVKISQVTHSHHFNPKFGGCYSKIYPKIDLRCTSQVRSNFRGFLQLSKELNCIVFVVNDILLHTYVHIFVGMCDAAWIL